MLACAHVQMGGCVHVCVCGCRVQSVRRTCFACVRHNSEYPKLHVVAALRSQGLNELKCLFHMRTHTHTQRQRHTSAHL